ncbi:MAG: hypothetical protein GY938_16850 [Ketobacter sp.]|nr:hypothetical protein [Ketobacter sp.]
MTIPTISPELANLDLIPASSLQPFQGDLKELSAREYKKLKKSLIENGVFVPFFVWKETGKLLDGHQRERVFTNEGWNIDVPVVYISAKDETEAKKKLLLISSQYGKITHEGWDEFTVDLDGTWLKDTVHFDALPLVFEDYGGDEAPEDWKEFDETAADDVKYISCPHCGESFPQ